jgi:hypothetical protein
VIALLYAFIPDVSSAYWIFSVMTTQVYLVMYVLMFIAAVQLRRHQREHERGFKTPALTLLCVVGTIASIAAFFIGFVPPSQFENGNTATYIAIVGGGVLLIGFVIPGLCYGLRKPDWKTLSAEEIEATEAGETAERPEAAAKETAEPLPAMGAPRAVPLEGGADAEEPSAAGAPPEVPVAPGSPGYDPERHPTGDHPTRRKLIYGVVGFVVGAAVIAGLINLRETQKDEEAQAKADQVIAAFEAEGFQAPEKDLLVNQLGVDGGAVCEDPGAALNEAQHRAQLANGAAQVGLRPVITDEDVVQGGLLILDVYCPDKAQEVRDYLDDLKYDDVVHQ